MFKTNVIDHRFFSTLRLAALLLLMLAPSQAFAQISESNKVTLTDKTSSISIARYLYVTPDPELRLSYNALINRHQNNLRGKRHDGNIINLGLGPAPTWMILNVENKTARTDWVLNFGEVFEGRYATIKKLLVANQSTGQTFARALREKDKLGAFGEDLNGPALAIKLRPNQTDIIVFYIEAEGGLPATIAPHLLTSKHYIQTLRFGDIPSIIAGIFFVSIIAFFIAVLYIERKPTYGFFIFYYFLLTALFFSINGVFFVNPSFISTALGCLYILVIAAGLPLTRVFLELTAEDTKENSMLMGSAILLAIGVVLHISFFDDQMLLNQLVLLVPPYVAMLVISFISFLQVQQGKYGAMFFGLGWLVFFAGSLLMGMAAANTGETSIVMYNAFWLSLLPQGVLFVLGTAKKIQMLDEEFRQEKIRESRMARSLARLKQSKESADQARLMRVIERERELMSELREREMQRTEEMRRAKETADQANRAKSAFLAVVTHEIRTPMTGIMGMTRLLLDTKLSSKQSEYAMAIQKSGDTMIALLNDILDFEKSKGGKMELEYVDFDVLRLVQDVVILMSGRTAEKNLFLKSDIDPSVPRYVKGDPARLRQVLLNLVTNAIKFTAKGGVTIRLRAIPVDPENRKVKGDFEVYFGIEDTGIGISDDVQRNLFVPFMQADASVNRKYGGTGLGLAICKKLIEAMGGTIAVNSQMGAGTTFFFTLLMEEGQADLAALTDAPKNYNTLQSNIPAQNILVVEDNEMNRRVLQGLLEKYGHNADLAKSGEDALEKIQRKQYDLVLMDIELPGMSGEEATQHIRRLADRRAAATPIIALTGHIMMEDIERFYEANMNGHLAKPIQPEHLQEAIKSVYAGELDNPIVLSDVVDAPAPLEGSDYTSPIQRFLHGQGISKSKIIPSIKDVDLDEEDSFEQASRSSENEKRHFENVQKPAEAGFDLLNLDMLNGLRDTLGNDQMESLLGGFFETCEQIISAIEGIIIGGDLSNLQARAHELKGMAANFGVARLGDVAGNVEKLMREGQSDAAAEEARALAGLATQSRGQLRAWMG